MKVLMCSWEIIQTRELVLHNGVLVAGNTKTNENFIISSSFLYMREILVSYLSKRKKRGKLQYSLTFFCSLFEKEN